MGCFGKTDAEKGPPEQSAKWTFITLSDFKCTSNWTPLAYIWLWIMALVGVAVYAVDTFTAVNLLVFDKWSGQIQPKVDFKISKWIFAGCILLSWALCFYEWLRAIRVMKRGGVAESYMDPLAASLMSMKPPRGWRRFLVFGELTKSKKGVDYVAFFVYFAFNSAIRVILAEGPRQFVNAVTLYAVMQADLIPGANAENSGFVQFWANLKELAEADEKQSVILFSMLFTLVIWVISALSLIIAIVLYLVFLWHYIPQKDGRLSVYCRRKIDKRLEKIVEHKVKAAMEEEEKAKARAEKKEELKRQRTGELPPPKPVLAKQPTRPQIGGTPDLKKSEEEKMAGGFGLVRQDTSTSVSTLPPYTSRPPTRNGSDRLHRQPTLPDVVPERPGMPTRTTTQGSAWSSAPSYESDAPLLSNAGYAGGRSSPAPPMPPQTAFSRQDSQASLARPMRSQTPNGRMDNMAFQQPQRPFSPMTRMNTNTSQQPRPFSPMAHAGIAHSPRPPPEPRGPPMRSNTGFSFDASQGPSAIDSAGPVDPYGRPTGPPSRVNTSDSFRSAPMAMPGRQNSQASGAPSFSRPMYGSLHSQQSSFSRPNPQRRPSPGFERVPVPMAAAAMNEPPVARNSGEHIEESYEMMPQPPYGSMRTASPAPVLAHQASYYDVRTASPAPFADGTEGTGYVAFNPSVHRSTPSPSPPPPSQLLPGLTRNPTVTGSQHTTDDYFGAVSQYVPQRSATEPATLEEPARLDNRLTTGYNDILDDYGSSARNSLSSPPAQSPSAIGNSYHQHNSFRRPSPPDAGIQRAWTAGPSAPSEHHPQWDQRGYRGPY